jgi:hypothetical protein
MQDMIELTALKEGMKLCQEMLKRTYRAALEAKRVMRRCLERDRSFLHHAEVEWKRQGVRTVRLENCIACHCLHR